MRLLVRWATGLFSGTLLVWVTSPLFVRSYHAKFYDPVCRSWVYPAGTTYRWRSEGYATTVFGPRGMPGRYTLPDPSASRVIALWGDSQAEGVTLPDDQKLWANLQRSLTAYSMKSRELEVLPMAHSGENAVDWVQRFANVEAQLGVDEHFILVCELEDLLPLANKSPNPSIESLGVRSDEVLDIIPDFVIHAARGLIFDGDSQRFRKLRFSVGPLDEPDTENNTTSTIDPPFPGNAIAAALAESTSQPITIIYAPRLPLVIGDHVYREDSRATDFQSLAVALNQHGIRVIDCRDGLRQAAAEGHFPHGFHNGVFGSGHLNSVGYRVIVDTVASKSSN